MEIVKKLYRFFKTDDTLDEAASLSFYTIFAVIPTLLIALSLVTKIEGADVIVNRVNNFLVANLLPVNQEAVLNYVNEFIANSAQIGVMGVIFVIVTSVFFFMDYEYIINKVYKTEIRNYFKAIFIYLLLTVLFPIMLAFTFYISDEFRLFIASHSSFKDVDTNSLLSYLIVWSMFFVSYKISPNKEIRTRAVLISSLVASFVWTGAKNLFIYYAIYNTNYVSLYGHVSILMLFMLWVFVSWIIFIYGLKFCKYLEEGGSR